MKLNYDFDIYVFFGDGINKNSSKSEIKKAYVSKYIALFQQLNDSMINPLEKTKISEQITFLNTWYNLLRDDKKREEYNNWLFKKNETEKAKFAEQFSAEKILYDIILIKNEISKIEKKIPAKDVLLRAEIANLSNKIVANLNKYNVHQISDNSGSSFSEEFHIENSLVKLYDEKIKDSFNVENIDMNNSVKLVDEVLERGFIFYNTILTKSIVNTSIVKREIEVNEELMDFLNNNEQKPSFNSANNEYLGLELTREFTPNNSSMNGFNPNNNPSMEEFNQNNNNPSMNGFNQEPAPVNQFNQNNNSSPEPEVDPITEKINRLNAEISQIEKEYTEEEDVVIEVKETKRPGKSIAELRRELESESQNPMPSSNSSSVAIYSRPRPRHSILDEDLIGNGYNYGSSDSSTKLKKEDKKTLKLKEKEEKKNTDTLHRLMSK